MQLVQWELVKWIGGLFSVLCLIVLLMIWYNFHGMELKFTTKRIGYLTVLGIISFTISAMIKTYHSISYDWKNVSKLNYWIPSVIYSLSWCFGQIFVYLLFIEKLKYSFNGTKYESSSKYYYKFYVGIALFGIVSLTFQITHILHELHIIDAYLLTHSDDARNIIQTIIDLTLSIGLLYVFLSKLLMLNDDLYIFNNDNCNSYSLHSLNNKQESIIKIASRLTVISSFAITSTQIYLLFSTSLYLFCQHINCRDYLYKYFGPITSSLWTIDCFINCFCIFMSSEFVMAKNIYHNVCYFCDIQCNKCCKSISKRRVKQPTDFQMPLLNDIQL